MQCQGSHLVHPDPEPDRSYGASGNIQGLISLAWYGTDGQPVLISGTTGINYGDPVIGPAKGVGYRDPASRPYSSITGPGRNHRHFNAVGNLCEFQFVQLVGDLQITCGNGA